MKLTQITYLLNAKLGGELLSFREQTNYLDKAIDEINRQLNTCYPVFSELDSTTAEDYSFFPDMYIRSIVIPCAAYYYYCEDEEGINTAPAYLQEYRDGLFYMLRDFSARIPEAYQADAQQGSVLFEAEKTFGERGVLIDGNEFDI